MLVWWRGALKRPSIPQVPKPGADEPHPCGLGPQASLAPHFNHQELCGLAPEGALPETPWSSPLALAAELTVVQWPVETGAQPPEEFARPCPCCSCSPGAPGGRRGLWPWPSCGPRT